MSKALGHAGPDWLNHRRDGADVEMMKHNPIGRRITLVEKPERVPAVYFVSANGLVKIGRINRIENLQDRLLVVQMGCPHQIRLRLLIDHWGQTQEKAVHKVFRDSHHRGEWFREDGELARFLTAVAQDHDVAVAWLALAISR